MTESERAKTVELWNSGNSPEWFPPLHCYHDGPDAWELIGYGRIADDAALAIVGWAMLKHLLWDNATYHLREWSATYSIIRDDGKHWEEETLFLTAASAIESLSKEPA